MTALRTALAVAAGLVVACLAAYFGAAVVVLATIGIPLGSTGRAPTAGEYVVLLVVAGGAGALGGAVTRRLARTSARSAVHALAAILAAFMLVAFTGAGVQWPGWWAPALAITMAAGALVPARQTSVRSR